MSTAAGWFDPQQICARSFVRSVELHESLPSTNDRAIELAGVAGLESPALVLARQQTAGRGRGGNRWWSADGALTFSLLLEATAFGITPRDWPRLSLTTAVAVCDALQDACGKQDAQGADFSSDPGIPFPARCSIKWPNDVLLGGRKVCGILIESPGGTAPAKDRLIIGVGINVNNSWRGASAAAGAVGTALCDVTGQQHDLQHVLVGFIAALEQRLVQLGTGDPQLVTAWKTLDGLSAKSVRVDAGNQHVEGRCLGIDEHGALLVETGRGPKQFYAGTARALD
jgi:BirA family biotin operon repressor/biotin-[acetyl-CoA-carboxylase] ligase